MVGSVVFFRQGELKNAALRVDVWRGHQTQQGVDTFILCYKQRIKGFAPKQGQFFLHNNVTCDVKQTLPDYTDLKSKNCNVKLKPGFLKC